MNSREELWEQKKRLVELYEKRKFQKLMDIEKHKQNIIQKGRLISTKTDHDLLIEDVLRKMTLEQLIEKIGIEKIETVLRAHKIKKLKNKL